MYDPLHSPPFHPTTNQPTTTLPFNNIQTTPRQYDVYRSVLALPEFQLLTRRRQPCDCSRRTTGSVGQVVACDCMCMAVCVRR